MVVPGVSSEFALSRMDDEPHPEIDVYVEDDRAKVLVQEVLNQHDPEALDRIQIVTFGSASVGKALGQMVEGNRFARRSVVFLDGDQEDSIGCELLPGHDAPERVVFESINEIGWGDVADRIDRSFSTIVDTAQRAMTNNNHHLWITEVADEVRVGGHELWRAMCSIWVKNCADEELCKPIIESIRSVLDRL